MDPTRPPTTPTPNPADGAHLRVVPVVLAGIAGDPELSLAGQGRAADQPEPPADRPLTRAELLAHGHEARWQVDAALAELVETRWLAPIGEGRFALRQDLDDPNGLDQGGSR